jgi:hypothetical protein
MFDSDVNINIRISTHAATTDAVAAGTRTNCW